MCSAYGFSKSREFKLDCVVYLGVGKQLLTARALHRTLTDPYAPSVTLFLHCVCRME